MPAGQPPMDERLVSLAEKLRPAYEAAGLPLPEGAVLACPVLYVGGEGSRPPIQRVARCVSDLLAGKNLLFLRGKEIGEIDMITGEWTPMTPQVFVTWIVDRAGILPISGYDTDKETGKRRPIESEMGVEQARIILASPNLRIKLPHVRQINRVKLPVFRQVLDERDSPARKGFRKIELLQPGYDAETETFTTAGGEDFNERLDPNEAALWLQKLLRDFPWGDVERSKSVFVCAFLTLFCRNLYLGKAPMFLFVSNLPGSGKSMLTRVCIEPVVGMDSTAPSGWNRDDRQETRKELDAAAQEFSPYIWFDDVDRCKVMGSDLNRWLTGKTWACRVMGTKERFKGPLYASTFLTGNGVTVDDNLDRRTLWVDLFAKQSSRDRKKDEDRIELDEGFFDDPDNMRQCLAVMWALVRWWDSDEMCRVVTKQRHIESFEGWSQIVPSIAACSGFTKGLVPYESPDTGNQEGREWKVLAAELIEEFCTKRSATSAEVTMRDVIRTARLHGLFQDKLLALDQVLKELEEKVMMKKFAWKRPAASTGPKVVSQVRRKDEFGLDEEDEHEGISEADKRLQAAEWSDRSMDSAWAKAWRKAAVAGQWFTGKDGKIYQFGDRSSTKGSKFVIKVPEE